MINSITIKAIVSIYGVYFEEVGIFRDIMRTAELPAWALFCRKKVSGKSLK